MAKSSIRDIRRRKVKYMKNIFSAVNRYINIARALTYYGFHFAVWRRRARMGDLLTSLQRPCLLQ